MLFMQKQICSTAFVPLQQHVACSPAAARAAESVEAAKVLQGPVPEPYLEPLSAASN